MKKFKSTKEVFGTYFPSLKSNKSELLAGEIYDDYKINLEAKNLSDGIVKNFFDKNSLEIDDEHSEEETSVSHGEQTLTADETVETVMNRKRGLFRYRR